MANKKGETGETTKPLVDPMAIFLCAEGYFKACQIMSMYHSAEVFELMRIGQQPYTHLDAPSCVFGAFTLELYMKCLYVLDFDQNPRWGHNLKELFEFLSPETRQKTEIYFNEFSAPHVVQSSEKIVQELGLDRPPDLMTELGKCTTAFEFFRYAFEGKAEPQNYTLGNLEFALRRVILERKREWKPHAARLPKPPQVR